MKYSCMVVSSHWYRIPVSLLCALSFFLNAIPKVQPQTTSSANETKGNADTESDDDDDSNLSSLDKIIISISCGIFMGLVILFFWNLCEIRYYVASQHRLLLRNNTSGSFPQRSPNDPNGVDSTTSENDGDAVGHYTITSAVTSSSSSYDNVKEAKVPSKSANFESPQSAPKEFPFLYADSPDFGKMDDSLNTDALPVAQFTTSETTDTGKVPYDDPEPLGVISALVDDSASSQNDSIDPFASDIAISPDEAILHEYTDATNIHDEEFSVQSATTAFDVLSIGSESLEQSMASSVMQ